MSAYEYLFQEEVYQIKDNVIIVLDKPWANLSEEEQTLLSKILNAVKLSLGKVQILHAQNLDLLALEAFKPCKVISFGVTLSAHHESFKVHSLADITFIQTDTLDRLTDITKKSLWLALKEAFVS